MWEVSASFANGPRGELVCRVAFMWGSAQAHHLGMTGSPMYPKESGHAVNFIASVAVSAINRECLAGCFRLLATAG